MISRASWIERGLSRLFNSPGQRHDLMAMLDLLLQFAAEFLRALLVDELSERVRGRLGRRRGSVDGRRVLLGAHLRNRERLLNKLLTEISKDL